MAASTNIAAQIVARLHAAATKVRVADVRIGLGYTAVMLADKRTGVAFTFRDQAKGGCSVFDSNCPLATKPASELLPLLESQDPIEAAVGLACANALVNQDNGGLLDGDILNHLEFKPEDRVGMVGNFAPLVGTIQERVSSLTVFERIAEPSGLLRPREEALAELPQCQVVLITATAVINHTIDGLLDAALGCREVALLGASATFLPEVFGARNVTMLSGVVVKNPDDVLRVVSEGGGMRKFGPYVRKANLRTSCSKNISARPTK